MSQRSPFQSSTSTVTSPAVRSRPSDVTRGSSTTSSSSLTVSTSPYSRMTSSPTGTGSSGASPTGVVEYPKTGMRAGPIGPSKPGVADPLRLIKVEQNPLAQQAKQTVMMLEKQNTLKKELREEVVRDDDPGNWESSLSSWKNRRRSSSSYTPKVLDLVVEPDADFLAATTATTTSTADRRNGKTFQQLVDEKKERSDGNTNSSYMYDDSPQSPVFLTENEHRKNSSSSSSVFQTETRQHLPKQHTSAAAAAANPAAVDKSYRTPSTGLVASAVDKYDKHEDDVSVRRGQVEVRSTSSRVTAAAAAADGGGDAVVNDVVHRRYKYSQEEGKAGKISPAVDRLENHSGGAGARGTTAVNVEMRTTTTLPPGTRNNRPEVSTTEELNVTNGNRTSSSSNNTTFPAPPRYPYSPDLNDNDTKSDHRHVDGDYGGSRTAAVTHEVTEFRKDTELSRPASRVSLSSTTDKKTEMRPDSDDSELETTENIPQKRSTMTSSITVTLKQSGEAGDNSNRSISPSFSARGQPQQGGITAVRHEQQTTSVVEKHVTATNKPELNNGFGEVQFRSDHRNGNDTATKEEPVLAAATIATEAADVEPPPLPNVPPPELDWDTYPTSGSTADRHSDDDSDDGDAQIRNQGQGHGAQGGQDEDGSAREKMNRRRNEFLGLTVDKF